MTVTASTAATTRNPADTDPAGVRWLIVLRDRGIFVLWVLLLLLFSVWAHPFFASLDNAILIANAAALTAIFAAGVAVGIICGALDLSIPGTAAFAPTLGLDAVGWSVVAAELVPAVVVARPVTHWLRG